MATAVYPGSFDPITLGHVDIVTRASRLFERIIMAVVKNPNKQPWLPLEDRVALARECLSHLKNVEIQSFEGLTVTFARDNGAGIIIRGLRAVSDFEYEFMMSQMNKNLSPQTETVFMMAGLDYQFLSSSMVREVADLGGDVSAVVPPAVNAFLRKYRPARAG